MKEINCAVIRDLLPLYVDEIVSDDTKKLVNSHLQGCEQCKKEFEQMKGTLFVPIENKTSLFSQLNKQWNRKKWLLVIGSILMTAVLGFALFSYIFYYTKPIPYTTELFEIEEAADKSVVISYFGESHAGIVMTHPMEVEIDGEIKHISLIYFKQTIGNSPTRNLLQNDQTSGTEKFTLPDSQNVDAVYYGEFDLDKVIIKKEQTWEELLQQMTLIWERP